MIMLRVVRSLDGELADVPRDKVHHLRTPMTIGTLDGGMDSGKPSVGFIFTLPDGAKVFAETSLALFQAAAKAFEAWHGRVNENQTRTDSN